MFSLSLSPSPWSRFEDGTVSFLDIIAVNHGFEALNRITGAVTERADPSQSRIQMRMQVVHSDNLLNINNTSLSSSCLQGACTTSNSTRLAWHATLICCCQVFAMATGDQWRRYTLKASLRVRAHRERS